jgi:hypothetical protein
MDHPARNYSESAIRWCQWVAVALLCLGLAGAGSLYFFADRRFQWLGVVVGGTYAIPSIALVIFGELIKRNNRWALPAAFITYIAIEIVFGLNVVATLLQGQMCGALVGCLLAALVLITIVKIADALRAVRQRDRYYQRGFDPITAFPNDVSQPGSWTGPTAAVPAAEATRASPWGLGWAPAGTVMLLVMSFDFVVFWVNRESMQPNRPPPRASMANRSVVTPPIGAPVIAPRRVANPRVARTRVTRKSLPSQMNLVKPDLNLDADASKTNILKRLQDRVFSRPKRSSTPTTYFEAVSSPGDWVGQGRSYRFGEPAVHVADLPADEKYLESTAVTVRVGQWTIEFGPPRGEVIDEGEYPNAQRWPFNNSAPGLSVAANGHGCNRVTGDYIIWEMEVQGQRVTRLAVDFVQRCEGKSPLSGMVRYQSSLE